MYVPLAAERGAGPAILAGLETVDLLALDELERVAGDAEWERALFVILNEFLGRCGGLLLAATVAAAGSGLQLPDLASRAAGAVSYRLQPLDDADRALALLKHAQARGLDLDRAAAEYLLHRVDRDMTALGRWLAKLDRASLIEQRKITIPFIRGLLAAGSVDDE
jgi:DnaA family protein